MFSDEKSFCKIDMWDLQDDGYSLNETTSNDISCCLWDEVKQSEDSLLFMLEEQTPIKDCSDFGRQTPHIEENINKLLEECRGSSQQKRRRVLHFPIDGSESTSVFLRSKEWEEEQIDDGPSSSTNIGWNSQVDLGLSDGSCAFNSEAWDQASDGWLDDCLDSSMMQCNLDESTALLQDPNCKEASIEESHIAESNLSADIESDSPQENRQSSQPKSLKGESAASEATSTKIAATSIAYPFALIKPCGGAEGGLTLKDINKRLHSPPPPPLKLELAEGGDDPSFPFPMSAFSGKPVVIKTKIRTEGGKGSITIMRTKG